MEFIRNILLIDKQADQTAQIKKKILESSNKVVVFTLINRSQLTEVASKNNIKCLFLNANIGRQDIFYILRFFVMMKEQNNFEIPIFFTSEDFELTQEILKEFSFSKFFILHSPINVKEVAEKIQLATLGKTNVEAKAKTAAKGHNVDIEFMNVFINSTKNVLSEMSRVPDLINSPPVLKAQLKTPLDIAISAKILISSAYFKGSYYIAFPKQTFLNFYEIVVMEKYTEINSENRDFAGELANIIYGQCKKKFSEDGLNLDMVIPSLHMGDINFPVVIVIPFDCKFGKFYLGIAPGNI